MLRIRDVYPGTRILIFTHPGSRIQKAKTATKERGEKKLAVIPFLCSHKFHKIEHNFSFEELKTKFGPIFKELWNFLPKTLSLSSQKVGLGFGILDPEKTFSGSREQNGTGSRIRNTRTVFLKTGLCTKSSYS